jgi:hypothetical protein
MNELDLCLALNFWELALTFFGGQDIFHRNPESFTVLEMESHFSFDICDYRGSLSGVSLTLAYNIFKG